MTLSLREVRELLLSLWPPGRLYDWHTPTSKVSRYLDALADTVKTFAFDVVERLRREVNPATAVEKLPDWEDALGIADSYTARNGTVAQRQAAVVGKLREFGAFTLPNTRAILAPLLGYPDPSTLQLLEVDRTAMRTAHTYAGPGQFGRLFVDSSVYVDDGGSVGAAGVQVTVDLGAVPTPTRSLTLRLQAPDGSVAEWNTRELGAPASEYHVFSSAFVGRQCNGTWTLSIVLNAVNGFVELNSWALFVEGVGPAGLGGDIVDWGVYLDPSLAGGSGTPADLDATDAAMSRVEHAHTSGYLIFSTLAIPDDPRSLADACLPG